MSYMFYVRSARALGPQALSRAIPVHASCVPPPCTPGPPASRLAPLPPASPALPSTRQSASAFNQPLSFDTSRVTTMSYMFQVRSARALGPQALRQAIPVHASCVPPPHHTGPPAFRLAPLPPASHALPSTRQRASAFNQPVSFDTSSVTTMYYMFKVRSPRVPLAPRP